MNLREDEQAIVDYVASVDEDDLYSRHVKLLASRLSEAREEITAAQERERWIPCTEQMPPKGELVLTYNPVNGIVNIGSWFGEPFKWVTVWCVTIAVVMYAFARKEAM